MDICLKEDLDVAMENQIMVIYEPKKREFLVVPGEVNELSYLKEEVILVIKTLSAYDVLSLGETRLMLVPCCGKHFSWEEGLQREKDKAN